MLTRVILASALAIGFLGAANAQSSTANQNMGTQPQANSANSQQSVQQIPQEIRQKLSQDGFTDIKIVPGSYLVNAKDKNGDPVMMVIGPNSMMMLTEVPGSKTGTTGSASGQGATGSSSSNPK